MVVKGGLRLSRQSNAMKLKKKTLAAIALLFPFGSPAGFAALPVGPDESSMTDVAEAETSSGISENPWTPFALWFQEDRGGSEGVLFYDGPKRAISVFDYWMGIRKSEGEPPFYVIEVTNLWSVVDFTTTNNVLCDMSQDVSGRPTTDFGCEAWAFLFPQDMDLSKWMANTAADRRLTVNLHRHRFYEHRPGSETISEAESFPALFMIGKNGELTMLALTYEYNRDNPVTDLKIHAWRRKPVENGQDSWEMGTKIFPADAPDGSIRLETDGGKVTAVEWTEPDGTSSRRNVDETRFFGIPHGKGNALAEFFSGERRIKVIPMDRQQTQ